MLLFSYVPSLSLTQVVLLPRNKADGNAENHKKLLQAVKKGRDGNEGPAIMGSLLKESFDGCAK